MMRLMRNNSSALRCARVAISLRRKNTSAYLAPQLCGGCDCGKVSFEARGVSCGNYYSHSAELREAAASEPEHTPYLAAAAFKSTQIIWKGPVKISSSSPVSSDTHYICSCEKKQYLGVDASRSQGIFMLNLQRVPGFPALPDAYRPNHHVFYCERKIDVLDGLPKWKTIVGGDVIGEVSTGSSRLVRQQGSAHRPEDSKGDRPLEWTPRGVRKDVLPLSPIRPPESDVYHFTENDPPMNSSTRISPEKIHERVQKKYFSSPGVYVAPTKTKREVVVIGGGHNGLIAAAYLAKAGIDTLVLERRHIVGGAAVTEEIIPGFKFSRASYLAGLMRPQIIKDLELEKYGFKYLPRNPSSFTPTLQNSAYRGKYLILGEDEQENWKSIAQFSVKDADAFPKYEEFLGKVRDLIQPILDNPLPNPMQGSITERIRSMNTAYQLMKIGYKNQEILVPFYELMMGPADHILNRWFESEILKTTLATDAVVGALISPKQNGSAYVLLHHCMGEAAGKKGVWSYMEGGMGAVSESIARSAKNHGAEIVTNATVKRILCDGDRVRGVQMMDGSEILADTVLSGCTPYHTFLELMPGLARDTGENESSPLPADFVHHVRYADYSCGAFKINCAVDRLPNFLCYPSPTDGSAGPMHRGTVHFESLMEELDHAYRESSIGMPASRPVIEMTIPSSVDKTIAPPGKHVVQFFVQFAPYEVDPKIGSWADPHFKNAFADRVFNIVDEFCPGFSESVIGRDVLSPLDLERIFGLHKGSISHGSLSLHQLGYARPMAGFSDHKTPVKGLYMCASGTHPGGGVMGASGKNCATVVLGDRSGSSST